MNSHPDCANALLTFGSQCLVMSLLVPDTAVVSTMHVPLFKTSLPSVAL